MLHNVFTQYPAPRLLSALLFILNTEENLVKSTIIRVRIVKAVETIILANKRMQKLENFKQELFERVIGPGLVDSCSDVREASRHLVRHTLEVIPGGGPWLRALM